jgi:hypothetical protein
LLPIFFFFVRQLFRRLCPVALCNERSASLLNTRANSGGTPDDLRKTRTSYVRPDWRIAFDWGIDVVITVELVNLVRCLNYLVVEIKNVRCEE